MSMLALPESECKEILALFREKLPYFPNAWLEELAANYGLDAIKDTDPNDIIAILSIPGERHRIEVQAEAHETLEQTYQQMYAELAGNGIDPKQISASLLTILDSSAKFREISELIGHLVSDYPVQSEIGWSWHTSPSIMLRKIVQIFIVKC